MRLRLIAADHDYQNVQYDLVEPQGPAEAQREIGSIEIDLSGGAIHIIVRRIDEATTGPVALEVH